MPSPSTRPHGGFHSILERDHPYIFVDSCMQIWPDADFASAHRHGVTAYGVTAFMPHDSFEQAVEQVMFWHLVARRHPNLFVAEAVDDIRQGKQDQRAALLLFAQGGDWIGWKLHRIEAMYRLGLRVMIPAYNRPTICATASSTGRKAASAVSAPPWWTSATGWAWSSIARTSATDRAWRSSIGARRPSSSATPTRRRWPTTRGTSPTSRSPPASAAAASVGLRRLGPASDAQGHHPLAHGRRVHRPASIMSPGWGRRGPHWHRDGPVARQLPAA